MPCGPTWQEQRKWLHINGSFDYSRVSNGGNIKHKKGMTSAPVTSNPTASLQSRAIWGSQEGLRALLTLCAPLVCLSQRCNLCPSSIVGTMGVASTQPVLRLGVMLQRQNALCIPPRACAGSHKMRCYFKTAKMVILCQSVPKTK